MMAAAAGSPAQVDEQRLRSRLRRAFIQPTEDSSMEGELKRREFMQCLDTCVQLCQRFHLTSDDLVNKYEALLMSEGAAGTSFELILSPKWLQALTAGLEKQQTQKQLAAQANVSFLSPGTRMTQKPNMIPVYNKNTFGQLQDRLLSSPTASQPLSSQPLSSPPLRPIDLPNTPIVPLVMGPAKLKREETLLASKVEMTHQNKASVLVQLYQPENQVSQPYRYMHVAPAARAEALHQHLEAMVQKMSQVYKIEDYVSPAVTSQETVPCIGRIVCDGGEQRLTAPLLAIEPERRFGARRVPLLVESMNEYSFFPGQVVQLLGSNPTGQRFTLEQIKNGLPIQVMPLSKENAPPSDVEVLIASGPFCLDHQLSISGIHAVLQAAATAQVLILLGPFVDSQHPDIVQGHLDDMPEDLLRVNILVPLQKFQQQHPQCKLIIVPSTRDILAPPVMPQAPLQWRDLHALFVANPCHFQVGEFLMSATSADTLLHLGKQEISYQRPGQVAAEDRFSRLCRHLLQQRHFYPLTPPDLEMALDITFSESMHWQDELPHFVLLPSRLKPFVRVLEGCICINPGMVSKGAAYGSCMRLRVAHGDLPLTDRLEVQLLQF